MLQRDLLEPKRYQYLSQEDSDVYDQVLRDEISLAEARLTIQRLFEQKAAASQEAHRRSPY